MTRLCFWLFVDVSFFEKEILYIGESVRGSFFFGGSFYVCLFSIVFVIVFLLLVSLGKVDFFVILSRNVIYLLLYISILYEVREEEDGGFRAFSDVGSFIVIFSL